MMRKEAGDVPGVVICTVSLCDQVAYTLFDPRALHSFVSEQFVRLTRIKPRPLDGVLYVATLLNDKVLVSLGCSDCKIVIGDVEEKIDLAVF